jgi:hypothetical protein
VGDAVACAAGSMEGLAAADAADVTVGANVGGPACVAVELAACWIVAEEVGEAAGAEVAEGMDVTRGPTTVAAWGSPARQA